MKQTSLAAQVARKHIRLLKDEDTWMRYHFSIAKITYQSGRTELVKFKLKGDGQHSQNFLNAVEAMKKVPTIKNIEVSRSNGTENG